MKFTKEELKCLDLYNALSDTTRIDTDKVLFSPIENDVAVLQFSSKIQFFTLFEGKREEGDKEYIYPVDTLNSLTKFTPESEMISIEGKKIHFGTNGTFGILTTELNKIGDFTPMQVWNKINEKKLKEKIILKDLNKISCVHRYRGEEELNILGIINNYYITSDRYNITAAIKSSSELKKNYFFPAELIGLINQLKVDTLEIYIYDGYYMIQHNNTYIFLTKEKEEEGKILLPDIFSEKIRKFYDHEYKAIVQKKDLQRILNSMNLVTESLLANRIFITFKENKIIIENKDEKLSISEINANINSKIIDKSIVVSGTYLLSILCSIDSDIITFHIPENVKDAKAISIITEGKEQIYIHNLYEDINE